MTPWKWPLIWAFICALLVLSLVATGLNFYREGKIVGCMRADQRAVHGPTLQDATTLDESVRALNGAHVTKAQLAQIEKRYFAAVHKWRRAEQNTTIGGC